MTGRVFVVSEDEAPSSLSLVCEAVRMSAVYGRNAEVLLLHGDGAKSLACGAFQVYILGLKEDYADEAELASHLAQWFSKVQPEVILANATVRLRALMPMTAARLGCGLTADCTALTLMEDGSLLQIRPALGGNVTAGIVSTTRPQMATVRPGIFPDTSSAAQNGILRSGQCRQYLRDPVKLEFDLKQIISCISYNKSASSNTLAAATIIVAGGAGIGSREGFAMLEELAVRLGGCIGATRSAVNLGYAPFSCQIGQTGQIARPKLYLAVGISGAVQHLAGMSGAGTVIAVNNDSKAPVFDYSDYGMVGDWRTIIKQLFHHFPPFGTVTKQ